MLLEFANPPQISIQSLWLQTYAEVKVHIPFIWALQRGNYVWNAERRLIWIMRNCPGCLDFIASKIEKRLWIGTFAEDRTPLTHELAVFEKQDTVHCSRKNALTYFAPVVAARRAPQVASGNVGVFQSPITKNLLNEHEVTQL